LAKATKFFSEIIERLATGCVEENADEHADAEDVMPTQVSQIGFAHERGEAVIEAEPDERGDEGTADGANHGGLLGTTGQTMNECGVRCAMEFSPDSLSVQERYKLMIGAIVPRPIAFVGTVSPAGQTNLAPFSFFSGVGSNPMTLLFCPANTPSGGEKDTLRNCKVASEGGTGEFVVNMVPAALAERMALCAEPLAYGESEFDLAGLTAIAGVKVKAPRVAESPVSFECVTQQVIRTNPGQPAGGNIVIGRVVHVHVRDGLINERLHIDPAGLDAEWAG
jgi:flavin reductase (DIM6/NTAB) family NADH-FMN oxidoreductase RutF